jgi:hypothetical protein
MYVRAHTHIHTRMRVHTYIYTHTHLSQVGAHGTGARIPPVDEQVVSMRLVTPGVGPLTLSQEQEPELFNLAKVGLGALGVVSQVWICGLTDECALGAYDRASQILMLLCACGPLCTVWEQGGSGFVWGLCGTADPCVWQSCADKKHVDSLSRSQHSVFNLFSDLPPLV